MRDTLERHLRICEDLYTLALEENQHLTKNQRAPGNELLNRKRALLEQLTGNLDQLKRALPDSKEDARELSELKEKVRQKILQITRLDRENESLLLRVSLPSRAASPTPLPPPSAGSIARLYGQVLPPKK